VEIGSVLFNYSIGEIKSVLSAKLPIFAKLHHMYDLITLANLPLHVELLGAAGRLGWRVLLWPLRI